MGTIHTLKGKINTRQVWLDGVELNPIHSKNLINHSPDGFNWGYGGSGPAQLALAIVLHLTIGKVPAHEYGTYVDENGERRTYQDFKWEAIAKLPQSDFEIEFVFPY